MDTFKRVQNWLLIGIRENWETALAQPVPLWGLRLRYQAEFQALNIGDIVWCYVTRPISGIIGLGIVKDKYNDSMNLVWKDELIKKEVIWPLRFRIQVLKMINRDRWSNDKITVNDFNLNWQIGFQLLRNDHLMRLSERAEGKFGTADPDDYFSGATIIQPVIAEKHIEPYVAIPQLEKTPLTHRNLQETIAEIGKLQFYHSQLEYPIDLPGEDKNIDVVWKREIAGVPTFAFEVELSGGIERAIARLKFAYNRWNSQPRIIAPKEISKKINNIIATESRIFSQQFKMYDPEQMIDLLNKKRELKTIETNLGIP